MLDSWGASSGAPGALEPLPGDAEPKISTTTVIHARKRGRAGSDHSAATNDTTDSPSVKKRTLPPSPAVSRCGSTTESDSSLAELLPTHDDTAFAARAAGAASFTARLAAAGELVAKGDVVAAAFERGSDRRDRARADVREGAVAAVVDVVLQATAALLLMPATRSPDELRAQAEHFARRLVAAHDRGAVQHAAEGLVGLAKETTAPAAADGAAAYAFWAHLVLMSTAAWAAAIAPQPQLHARDGGGGGALEITIVAT